MKHTAFATALCLIAAPALAQQGQPGAHFIENWDMNGDGAVTVSEAAERRSDVFYSFDSNEDGFLDAEEYVAFDEARAADMENESGHGQGAMKSAADGMQMSSNDVDGDGRVSASEFETNAAVWIRGLDTNGDGVVTTADFGRRGGQGQGQGQKKGKS
jgi:hypothetical protein